jgi:lipopolysaccharide/colanic/teichoic acid biosynthesis glycosyltransferase
LRQWHVDGNEKIREFVRQLRKKTRETDTTGWVAEDIFGVILTGTDKNGAKLYVDKILKSNGFQPQSVAIGVYPELIFNRLLDEKENQPDFFPLELEEFGEKHTFQLRIKRGIDILGSILGMMIISPLMLIVALAIKISSPGPIIFKQIRLGMKGEKFSLYKFRSMYWNCDDLAHRKYVANLIGARHETINQGSTKTPFFKMKADARITPLGRIMRKLSLDELPQLFNVLKGDMSLVGPRPPLSYEIEKYEPWHVRRIFEMKPGITGLWQVSGRNKTTFNEMVRLDLRFVKSWSLWMDFKIILKTFKEVIGRRDGA